MAITLMLFFRTRGSLNKLGLFGVLAVMFGGFMISGSRGATLGLIATFAFLVWRSRYRAKLLWLCAAAAIVMGGSPLIRRFLSPDMSNADGRIEIWKVGFAALRHYWLGGAGIGNFPNAFAEFYFAVPHIWLPWDRVAHSILLQSAVESGVIGFALFLTFWYLIFREPANVPPDHPLADICVALRASALGLFVVGVGLDLMDYKYTWLLFSLIAVVRTVLTQDVVAARLRGSQAAGSAQPQNALVGG
jgi:hypothetical protein